VILLTLGTYFRACAGADLAINSLRITLSKLIWAFDILPLGGETYNAMDIVSAGIIYKPKPFKCRFEIRSEKHQEVLWEEFQEAEKVLEAFPAFE
jgi:hypothetical protein